MPFGVHELRLTEGKELTLGIPRLSREYVIDLKENLYYYFPKVQIVDNINDEFVLMDWKITMVDPNTFNIYKEDKIKTFRIIPEFEIINKNVIKNVDPDNRSI